MPDKVLSMLGLARRAGKLKAGYDLSVEAIRGGKAALAVAARDISEKTFKNMAYEAQRMNVPAIRLQVSMEELSAACGVRAGVLTLTDRGFAEAITGMSEEEK